MRQQVLAALAAFPFAAAAAPADTPLATATAAAQLPLEHFTRHDEFGDAKISPDGEYLAMTAGKYGRSAIAFVRRSDRKVVGGARAPEGQEIDECHWVAPAQGHLHDRDAHAGHGGAECAPARSSRSTSTAASTSRSTATRWRSQCRHDHPRPRGELRHLDAREHAAEGCAQRTHHRAAVARVRRHRRTWSYDPDAQPRITLLDTYSGSKKSLGTAPLSSARCWLIATSRRASRSAGTSRAGWR